MTLGCTNRKARAGLASASLFSDHLQGSSFTHHLNTISDDMSGPVASNLVLLSDLKTIAQGTKVRFLGW